MASRASAAVGAFVARNPAGVAGSTAFVVALLYVSANALWYQPHAHTEPFFVTRSFDSFISPEQRRAMNEPQTTIHLERAADVAGDDDAAAEPTPRLSDPVVEKVQKILSELNFYPGDVDGLKGPATRQAVEAYQRKMGLNPSGQIDQELLEHLGADQPTGSIPMPSARRPAPSSDGATAQTDEVGDEIAAAIDGASKHDDRLVRIQAGLRAYGRDEVTVDGLMGARTRSAIKEFQAANGLPQTGEADEAVLAKMKQRKLVR